MTLTEFLLARIAEVEELATSVASRHRDNAESNFALWVLVDSEAKRRIVDLVPVCADEDREDAAKLQYVATLKHLALPYADHQDYREEWRP